MIKLFAFDVILLNVKGEADAIRILPFYGKKNVFCVVCYFILIIVFGCLCMHQFTWYDIIPVWLLNDLVNMSNV